MKLKNLVLPVILCITAVLTVGCSNRSDSSDTQNVSIFKFDSDGNYTGFSDVLAARTTMESAEKSGYVVKENLDISANEDKWNKFVSDSSSGQNAYVRIASFYDDYGEDEEGPYFQDIYYQDEKFYLFDSTAESNPESPYKHMLILEGKAGNPVIDSGVIVLTDDETLTFDEVTRSMLSSSMEYIQSVSPFRLVMFFNP